MQRIRASALCFQRDSDDKTRFLVVRLRDPFSGTLYRLPPGGEIAPGETPVLAAQRETLEETGADVHVLESTELVVDYLFYWGGQNYPCRTHFFLADLKSQSGVPSPPEPYVEGHDWLSLEDFLLQIKFHPELRERLSQWLAANKDVYR